MIKRALISVSDKEGVISFAKYLSNENIEIISTGGTYKLLNSKEIKCKKVEEITNFPEILNGRVKTLHPKIFGGILSDNKNKSHLSDKNKYKIKSIDIVAVNLYPFEKVSINPYKSSSDIIEQIDIGGVSLLRAGAKNFKNVIVIIDKQDYKIVLDAIKNKKEISLKERARLAKKAFNHTSNYDKLISQYINSL